MNFFVIFSKDDCRRDCQEFHAVVGHDEKRIPPPTPRCKEPKMPDVILDQLLAGADAAPIFDPNGLLDGLKKAIAEQVLNAEMDEI